VHRRFEQAESDAYKFMPEGSKGHDGAMALSRLHRMADMAADLQQMIQHGDELPPWVQDHLAVAYSKLSSVYSYIEPRAHL
jgi:hypothetical protein